MSMTRVWLSVCLEEAASGILLLEDNASTVLSTTHLHLKSTIDSLESHTEDLNRIRVPTTIKGVRRSLTLPEFASYILTLVRVAGQVNPRVAKRACHYYLDQISKALTAIDLGY